MNATTTATTTSFTIKAPLFDDLLSGALIAAGKDSSLPVLTCLQLESRDGKLIAAATDRYRLFIGRLSFDTLELKPESDLKILILRDDVAKIRSLIKPLTGKRVLNPYVQLTVDGERITVSTVDGSTTFLSWGGTFPPYEHLIPTVFEPSDEIGVNPAFLGDMAKVPGIDKGVPLIIRTSGAKKPLLCETRAGDIQWQLLLMPMRVA
jgi:DNA polymerase III subunit beta